MVALIISDRGPREWSENTVHFSVIIPLRLERGLHVGDHLIGRQVVISVDWPIISIIGIRIVAPRRILVAGIPVVRAAEYENDAVITAAPPVSVVPLRSVTPEGGVV